MSDSEDGGSNSPLRFQPGGSLYTPPPAPPAVVAAVTAALGAGAPAAVVAAVAAAAQAMVANGQANSIGDAIRKLQDEQGGVSGMFSGSSLGMFKPGSGMDDNEGGFGSATRSINPASPAAWGQTAKQLLQRGLDPSLLEAYQLMVELQVANPDDPDAQMIESYIRSQPSWATVMSNADQHARGGALGMFQKDMSWLSNPLGNAKIDQLERGAANTVDDNFEAITLALLAYMTGGAASGLAAGAGSTTAGAVGGAVAGAQTTALQGGDGKDVLKGGALGALGGAAGGSMGVDATPAQRAAAGAGTGVAKTALTGGSGDDYLQSAARGAVSGAAGGGPKGMLPVDGPDFGADATLSPQAELDAFMGSLKETMSVPPTVNMFGPSSYMSQPGFMGAKSPDAALAGTTSPVSADLDEGTTYVPDSSGAPAAAKEPAVSDKDIQRYAKAAQTVDKIYQTLFPDTKGVQGFAPPERQEGQTDEEYFGDVGNAAIDYLGLDPATMREAGLIPGTPQYLDYILEQADAIIEQVFDDPGALDGQSPEDIKAALRDLNERDAQQLIRALHVRGALGSMTTAPSATDPFTGIDEELGMLPGDKVKGPEAARQRGLARSIEGLAGGDRSALDGLFGRKADLFGMQESADQRAAQARLAEIEEEERKRRKQRKA